MAEFQSFQDKVIQSFARVKDDIMVLKSYNKTFVEKLEKQDQIINQLFENQKQLLLRLRELEKNK